MSDLKKMGAYAVAVGTLSAITLTSLAVVQGFKDSGKVDNTTADNFITGIALFGGFAGVIVLALIGKLIIRIFQTK